MRKKMYLTAITGILSCLIGSIFAAPADTASDSAIKKSEASTDAAAKPLSPEEIKQLSEAFGHFIGRNLNSPGIKFDLEKIITGMRAGAAGQPAPMSDREYEEMMIRLQTMAFRQLSDDNLKAATEFLEKNSNDDKVVILVPHRLQYTILEEGSGATVAEHSSPQVEYTGKYLDGTVFGSSKDTGGPITIPLDQTIPGFSKALVGMKEGEKRRIFVHPELGYGTSGHLPPNSLLIFEVEVIKADAPKDADKIGLGDKEDGRYNDDDDSDDDSDDDDNDDDNDSDDDDDSDDNQPSSKTNP